MCISAWIQVNRCTDEPRLEMKHVHVFLCLRPYPKQQSLQADIYMVFIKQFGCLGFLLKISSLAFVITLTVHKYKNINLILYR